MRPVVVIQHTSDPDTGWLADAVRTTGLVEQVVQPRLGDSLPPREQVGALVVLGGPQGAYEEDRYPYLVEEKRYLREADDAGVPILGICLGAQLLADAMGGHTFRAPTSEVGYPEIRLTAAGLADPVLGTFRGPVLVWHHDTFELPPDSELLAETDLYPHAFRRGNTLGVQFHPEANPTIIERWLRLSEEGELARDGIDPSRLLDEARANESHARRASRGLFTSWLRDL